MEIGTKVIGKWEDWEYVGYIASIDNSLTFPYIIAGWAYDIGKSFDQLVEQYGLDSSDFGVFELEDLTVYKGE